MSESLNPADEQASETTPPLRLNPMQRRILGVLMEKARTTPDSYPLSLNALVTGCNQKSNRSPVMNITPDQVEDELFAMREKGLVAEVHGGGRVPKYRHFGYDYLGVKGIEAGVMTELLLRGEQTAGDLRSRASRFGSIADLKTMQQILDDLHAKGLVTTLTPPGRGQLFTHTLYAPEELQRISADAGRQSSSPQQPAAGTPNSYAASAPSASVNQGDLVAMQAELVELRLQLQQLTDRLDRLES